MVLWVVGLLIAIPFFIIVASLVLELVVPLPEEHGPRSMVAMAIALMLLALGGVMAWLGLRARRNAARTPRHPREQANKP